MKTTLLFAALAAAAALPSFAAENGSTRSEYGKTERGQLVYQIVNKWAPHVQELHAVPMSSWAKNMGPTFATASISDLQDAANADNFDTVTAALFPGQTKSTESGITTKALGDIAQDLVFVPISPCRILDTRSATAGQIAAGETRAVDVNVVSSYAFQGGASNDCNGLGSSGSFAAVAVNFTSVLPAETGFFTAFPYATTRPLAATQVYQAGNILSNMAIVQLDQGTASAEMSVYSEKGLHLVGDVVGYFTTSPATALECVETAEVRVTVAPNSNGFATAPACAAGYTETRTICGATSWYMPTVFQNDGRCSIRNNGTVDGDMIASRECCRVPGR